MGRKLYEEEVVGVDHVEGVVGSSVCSWRRRKRRGVCGRGYFAMSLSSDRGSAGLFRRTRGRRGAGANLWVESGFGRGHRRYRYHDQTGRWTMQKFY